MKLFLASSIDKTLPLLNKLAPGHGKNVLFVANAADPYTGDKFWVDSDRNAFKKLGYQIHEADLRETTPQQLEKLLKENNILHICGGSVYYLAALLAEKGLDKTVINAIRNETVVYTGTSAGSIIVSKNLKPFSYDQEEKEFVKKVSDHKGLEIIDFGIVPHCNNPDFINEHQKIIEQMPNDAVPLFFLQDSQAIWVEDDCFKLLTV